MFDVYISVGSNISPESELRYGVDQIAAAFGEIVVSSVYRSPAFGFTGEDFLNVAVKAVTTLDPQTAEQHLDAIEKSGNRTSSGRYAPRALDCDMLMYGQRVDASARLPRDDVVRFPFVLGPLAEIAPQLIHPLDGYTIDAHWRQRQADAELTRVCEFAALSLPADAAAAVDGEDLAGHVSRIAREI